MVAGGEWTFGCCNFHANPKSRRHKLKTNTNKDRELIVIEVGRQLERTVFLAFGQQCNQVFQLSSNACIAVRPSTKTLNWRQHTATRYHFATQLHSHRRAACLFVVWRATWQKFFRSALRSADGQCKLKSLWINYETQAREKMAKLKRSFCLLI